MSEQKIWEIASEYGNFWLRAEEIAERDVSRYPLEKKETKRDRVTNHLIGMIGMYEARYGDPDQRAQIVNFLEKELFKTPSSVDDTCQLTVVLWNRLKAAVLAGEYRDLNSPLKAE